MRSLLLGLAACLGACASAPSFDRFEAGPSAAEMRYRLAYQGWFTVGAFVNGTGPHDFIVDSGATITSVFTNLEDEEGQAFTPTPGRTIQIFGLSGAKELPAYFLGDISFAGIVMTDHTGVVLPDWSPPNTPPQGVMGLDFLTRYTVHVDTRENVIRLYDPPAGPDIGRDWNAVKMAPLNRTGSGPTLYTIDLRIGSALIPCILDLGASGTIFNTAALREMVQGLRYSSGGRGDFMSTGSRINDVFDVRDTVRPIRIQTVKAGRAMWRQKVYIIYDAQIFEDLGFEKRPTCLVGADMFADRSIIFDFARETLYIGPQR